MIDGLAWLILAFPLMALGVQLFFGKQLPRQGDFVSTGAMGMSLLCGLLLFFVVVVWHHDPGFIYPAQPAALSWFSGGNLQFSFGFHIDALTAVMVVVVGVVSFLVHVYSMGYMRGEAFYDRYFAYLSLFSFSMLLLVLCDNLFVLYICWELVGVSSYLLIGFYFWRPSAADACKKAFITTRVGDVFMLIGLLMVVLQTGTFNYREIFEAVARGQLSGAVLTVAAICLFGGAVGKSAQFPLHVWLPDAMEGPTPVSALIHAATMVAAGVYMVGRLFPIFSASPAAMLVIAYIGLITAFFAATIAITQTDIKRVLAYSTVSQLGYMMTALGVGAYTAGLYHLMTHAFFKSLLFLCSGCVIHAVHTNEITQMGGLHRKMPVTALTMLIGTLALAGVPFFSGFGSKDAILAGALDFGLQHPQHLLIFLGLLAGAGITAFYMFRLIFLTFFGEPRDPERYEHAHEAPDVMTMPLVALAVLSIVGGFGIYGALWFTHLVVPPVIGEAAHAAEGHHGSAVAHYGAMVLSILAAFSGIALAYFMYYSKTIPADALAAKYPWLYDWSHAKYRVDEFYERTVIAFLLRLRLWLKWFDDQVVDGAVNATAPALRGTSYFSGAFDKYVVDGLVNLLGIVVQAAGAVTTLFQSGVIQNYLLKMGLALGVILLIHNVIARVIG